MDDLVDLVFDCIDLAIISDVFSDDEDSENKKSKKKQSEDFNDF